MHALRVRGIYGFLIRYDLAKTGICHLSERFAGWAFATKHNRSAFDGMPSLAICEPITSFSLAECGNAKGCDLGDLTREGEQSGRVALLEFEFDLADRCSRVAAFELSAIKTDFNFAPLPREGDDAAAHTCLEQ